MQIRAAIKAEDNEMVRDLVVISTTSGLRVTMRSNALTNPFQISSKYLHH